MQPRMQPATGTAAACIAVTVEGFWCEILEIIRDSLVVPWATVELSRPSYVR